MYHTYIWNNCIKHRKEESRKMHPISILFQLKGYCPCPTSWEVTPAEFRVIMFRINSSRYTQLQLNEKQPPTSWKIMSFRWDWMTSFNSPLRDYTNMYMEKTKDQGDVTFVVLFCHQGDPSPQPRSPAWNLACSNGIFHQERMLLLKAIWLFENHDTQRFHKH